jgi:long-chain fatty acid transport protein
MKKFVFSLLGFCLYLSIYAQTGHVMQGVGSVNMSMGGAATAQPLDISGSMYWNPATASAFDETIIKLDLGLFFSSPELSSSLPAGALGPDSPPVFGTTLDDRPASLMPAIAMLWGNADSKHTFGVSAFGISGFGVTFPQETNLPINSEGNPNPNWNPNNSNSINWPQQLRGFGRVESNYMLLQISGTWAYEISEQFSVGVQPNFNYAALELQPNPLAMPDMEKGYPIADNASSFGFGAQIGVFYNSDFGLKLGASYKTNQFFSEFEFDNTYLDGSAAPANNFQMDYPAILSFGAGYSTGDFDLALDYRRVFYENTEGFEASGWQIGDNGFPTGAVQGFGWQNISVVSFGIQFKGVSKLPLRAGYTYSSSPIQEDLAF